MKIKFDTNKKIGVAVSGGVDSMVLLDLMLKQSKNIIVLNVEHGIRGIDSQKDTNFVKQYAKDIGVDFISKSVDAISYSKEKIFQLNLLQENLDINFLIC